MDFETWLSTLPGTPTPTTAATKAKLTSSTILRHAERGKSTADNVIAIARAFNVSPVDALVDNQFLIPSEVSSETISMRQALANAAMEDILQALVNKLNESGLFEGTFTIEDLQPSATVVSLPSHSAESPEVTPDVPVDWENAPRAADSSPAEPGEGDEGYFDGA